MVVSPYNRSEDGRYFDGDAGVSWGFDHVNLKASDVRSYAEEGEHKDTVYAQMFQDDYAAGRLIMAQNIDTQIPLETRQRTLPLRLPRRLPLALRRLNQPPNRLLKILPFQLLQRPVPLPLHILPLLAIPNRHHNSRRALLRRRKCAVAYE